MKRLNCSNTLEKVISTVTRSSLTSTDALVHEYLLDNGYDDIAKELSKLRDCRNLNNDLSLQQIYDEFTEKNRKTLKRKLSKSTIFETETSLTLQGLPLIII